MLVLSAAFAYHAIGVLAEVEKTTNIENTPDPEVERINREIQLKKQQVEDIRARIKVQESHIQEKRTQAATLKNQIGILDNKIAKTELDLKATQGEIETVTLEIEALVRTIADREEDISRNKEYVAAYLRTIYRYDDRGYLEVLLLHDRFSEFFDVIQSLEGIEKSLAGRVLALKDHKASLEAQKFARDEKRTALESLQEQLSDARTRLGEEQHGKEVLVVAVQSSELDLRRSVASLKAEQQAIDNELTGLEVSLRKKLKDNERFQAIAGSGKVHWPVDPSRGITTYFHDPDYPFRYVFEHPGLDIRAAQGTPVRAGAAGVVGRVKNGGARGYSYILVVHPDGISTVYGHLSKLLVSEDQFVEAGDIIALSGGAPGTPGAGPLTTGPHLHFEVRRNGIPVNPLEYLGP